MINSFAAGTAIDIEQKWKQSILEEFYSTLTNSDLKTILEIVEGLDFNIVSNGSGTVMQEFINQYFKQPIYLNPLRSALGGEKVLSTLYATDKHPSSYHLMYFKGKQDKHFHPGPRLLNVFASKPWFLYAGGDDLSVLNQTDIPLVKISFPGNSFIQLRFCTNFIHGFEGEEFAAISMHYTDIEEVNILHLDPDVVESKDVMEKLTTVINQNNIRIIYVIHRHRFTYL